MTPEEKSNEVREIVWEMSSMTNKILVVAVILVLTIYYYFSHL